MRRSLRTALILAGVAVAAVWVNNTSLFAPDLAGHGPKFIAHRGVHQNFERKGLTNETCTAARMLAGDHSYLENTIASMSAAFAAGASVVELDIHLTRDGQLAVFHDWTLGCRTDGTGETRDASMEELRRLDVGYGYTSDQGKTYPFRGHGVGLLPSLEDVFRSHPNNAFLIDIKSNDPGVGKALASFLQTHPRRLQQVWGVYGGHRPVATLSAVHPELRVFTKRTTTGCLKAYASIGWLGIVPSDCHGQTVYVPINFAPWLWGWPNRFMQRMEDAGATVVVIGPHHFGNTGSRGLDTIKQFRNVPLGFSGFVQTDRIEVIGPVAETQRRKPSSW